jgi:hypothetical protein
MGHAHSSERCKMPLTTTDRLRFVEFLGLLAGLFVVFVSSNASDLVYFPFGIPSGSVFVLMLIIFIAYALFVYAEILSREKSSTKFMFVAAVYFSVILSLLFSGTILKALSIEKITTPGVGVVLFAALASLYNFVLLIPIRKIMKDEPLKVEIEETPKDSPAVIG